MRKLLVLILLLVLNLFFSDSVWAQERVLIKMKPGKMIPSGLQITEKLKFIDTMVITVPEAAREKILSALNKNPNIEFAEADYVFTTLTDDSHFSLQWGLPVINFAVYNFGSKVAILDTGINKNHEDLSGKIINEANFSGAATLNDIYGHGTHVAGIVAAKTDNGLGIAGVCPACELLNVKVLGDNGSGSTSNIVKGIEWAASSGAKIINMSLGSKQKSSALELAVNKAWNAGVVLVAAAGNSGSAAKFYPAAYANVIAVAATDNSDRKASFSNYGAGWVDLAAPGVNIYSTWKDGGYKYASGTSMASPFVAGAAGIVFGQNSLQSNYFTRSRLESSADKILGTGTYWSAGRLNLTKAAEGNN